MRKINGVSEFNTGDVVAVLSDDYARPWLGQVGDDNKIRCLRGWHGPGWLPRGLAFPFGDFPVEATRILEEGDPYYDDALVHVAKLALGVTSDD